MGYEEPQLLTSGFARPKVKPDIVEVGGRQHHMAGEGVDLCGPAGGNAYLTHSSIRGPGAIIVLDLAIGLSFRSLDGQRSTDL